MSGGRGAGYFKYHAWSFAAVLSLLPPPAMHMRLPLQADLNAAAGGGGGDEGAEAAAVDEYMRKAEVMGMDAQSRWGDVCVCVCVCVCARACVCGGGM